MVFLFFSFFGTGVPFRAKVVEVEEISTSNITNQILYSYLFIASCFTLIPAFFTLKNVVSKEKFFTIFILFATLSIVWSDYTFTSIKRIFQMYAVILTCLSFILHLESDEEMLKYIKPILYLYIIATIIVVIVVPGAKDPIFHTWRGFTTHKNDLGEIGLVCVLLSFFIYSKETKFKSKLIAASILLLSVVIVVGTFSSTSIITLTVLIGFGILSVIDEIFKPIGINRAVTLVSVFSVVIFILSVLIFVPDFLGPLTAIFGKDITFTGRTDIWAYMFDEIQRHLLLGTGFQSFWTPENPRVLLLYKEFVWLPNQAHNGYIDVMNQLGIIGFGLFLLMIINYFVNLSKSKINSVWMWFIIIALITNLQETTFLAPGKLNFSMVMFAYFVLFVNIYRKEREPLSDFEASPQYFAPLRKVY